MIQRLLLLGCLCVALTPAFGQGIDLDTVSQVGSELLAGSQLLNEYPVEDMLDQLEAPSPEEWGEFWTTLEDALQSGSLDDLSWLMPYAETAAGFLKTVPEGEPYGAWLEQRLDYFDMARSVLKAIPAPTPEARPPVESAPGKFRLVPPPRPRSVPPPPAVASRRLAIVRSSDTWKQKLAGRPMPANAKALVPVLKNAFRTEGVPAPWIWLAEVESTMNPSARSPVGAAGLFQFMVPTAERFGLKTQPVDERLLPGKSAHAAAKYLKVLYKQFDSWPLALAAYNAGEGRVSRLLKNSSTKTFEAIEDSLPVETQMYVPKVMATVSLREGVNPRELPAPAAMQMPAGMFLVAWVFK
jgi:membrane-bound lytic murein transglycosylase D